MKHFIHTILARLFYTNELENAVKGRNLCELANHKNSRVRQRVAEVINLPLPPLELSHTDRIYNTSVYNRLARDRCSAVRLALAVNPSCGELHLAKILFNSLSDVEVKLTVLERMELTAGALKALSIDSDVLVRMKVASHNNTAEATLSLLAMDENLEVRRAVAINPNTSKESLQSLLIPDGEGSSMERTISRLASDRLDEIQSHEDIKSYYHKEQLESQLKVEIQNATN